MYTNIYVVAAGARYNTADKANIHTTSKSWPSSGRGNKGWAVARRRRRHMSKEFVD